MKKLALAIAATSVLGMGAAQATTISMDVSDLFGEAAGTRTTSLFDSFTLQSFNPLSTYQAAGDCTADPSACTFTQVIDTASSIDVLGLNPLANPGNTAGFGFTWGLSLEWELIGTPVQIGTAFLGNFNAGTVNVSIFERNCDVMFNCVDSPASSVMQIDITGSAVAGLGQSSVGIEVFGNVSSVAEGYFFDQAGRDFFSLLADNSLVFAIASSDIKELTNAPGNCVYDLVSDTTSCSRETLLTSVDVSFEVPEPTSIAILGVGLLGMGFAARRRRNNKAA